MGACAFAERGEVQESRVRVASLYLSKVFSMLRTSALLLLWLPFLLHAQEVCNNGIDDDGNGLIDLNDPGCPCSFVLNPVNVPSFISNPSFEERTCCPFSYVYDVPYLSCAVGWAQATSATSDYFHTCGFAPSQFPLPPPDGDACVGFISMPGYKEYVGACIYDHPLNAGTSYTLSLWIAGLSMSGDWYAGQMWNNGVYYEGAFPLALYGHPDCIALPMGTDVCAAETDGWVELARVYHQGNGQWTNVSMTFTPAEQIKTIMIGAACDLPDTYVGTLGGPFNEIGFTPYTLVDDLHLTEAVDQLVLPVTQLGSVCEHSVQVIGAPPAGTTDHQWYLNGIALPGQTGTSMDASAAGYGGGTYTLASNYQGSCLMGNTNVAMPVFPDPAFELFPASGCAPLSVTFLDTTAGTVSASVWQLGEGPDANGAFVQHTYGTPGTYDVTLTVTNAAGCTADSTLDDAIVVHALPDGAMTIAPNPTDVEHTTVSIADASGSDIVSWWWDLGTASPSTSANEAFSAHFPEVPGSYPVFLVVTNAAGCADTVRSMVVVTPSGHLEMPNVFTPNGDGDNDAFIPLEHADAPGMLEIFNRWGLSIFTTSTVSLGWDGRSDGRLVPAGIYYYVVTPLLGENRPAAGYVTLLR